MQEDFEHLRRLLEARMGKKGRKEYIQVLRLIETFGDVEVAVAVEDALRLSAISYDAVKHLVLAKIERRAPRLDLSAYPFLHRPLSASPMSVAIWRCCRRRLAKGVRRCRHERRY